jgi:hypothetical protein
LKVSDHKKFRNRSFCRLDADLIESRAFLELSGKAAVICLIRFYQKCWRKCISSKKKGMKDMVITNQGEIVFTYGEARELGINSSRTFYKVLHELVEEKGFIDIADQGNWYSRQPTKFSISSRWKKFGTPNYQSMEMKRILPDGVGFLIKGGKSKTALPE